MRPVHLDLHEIEMAVQVGARRRLEALRLDMKDRHGRVYYLGSPDDEYRCLRCGKHLII